MYQPDKLKQKWEELGLEQQELAELIGVSKQAYFGWEKGLSKSNSKPILSDWKKSWKFQEGYLSEDEISLYKQLTEPNQRKPLPKCSHLVSSAKGISIAEMRSEYHVYEKLSAGIVLLFMATWLWCSLLQWRISLHDFASWVDGNSMELTYQNGEVAPHQRNRLGLWWCCLCSRLGFTDPSRKSNVRKKGSA